MSTTLSDLLVPTEPLTKMPIDNAAEVWIQAPLQKIYVVVILRISVAFKFGCVVKYGMSASNGVRCYPLG